MKSSKPEHHQEVAVEVAEQVEVAWRVVLYNDEVHTFEQVITQIIKAIGCSTGAAEDMTWKVHLDGQALIYEGEFERCLGVKTILSEISLNAQILG